MSKIRVLLVDDEELFRKPMTRWLEKKGYHVDAFANGDDAIEQVRSVNGKYDVALIDQVLVEGRDGIETMSVIIREYPHIDVIILTGWGESDDGLRALQAGAYRYIAKGVEQVEIDILIRSIADYKAIRQKLASAEKEKEWLGTLLSVTQAMQAQMGQKEQILKTIARAARELTDADYCALWLRDPSSGQFKFTPCRKTDFFTDSLERAVRPLGRQILAQQNPLTIDDTAADHRVERALVEAGVLSLSGVPVGQSGVLYIFAQKEHMFRQDAVKVLEMLASQAVVAIENAHLLEERKKRVEVLEKLWEVGTRLARADKPQEVLLKIAEGARELFEADSVSIWPYNAAHQNYIMEQVVCLGIHKKNFQMLYKEPHPEGVTATIMREGYIFVEDVDDPENRYVTESARKKFRQIELQSFVGIKLSTSDEVVGVLFLNYRQQRVFNKAEENTLKTYAGQAAQAIKNIRLLRQLNRALEQLEVTADFTKMRDNGKLEAMLKRMVAGLKVVLECDVVTLYRYDETHNRIIGHAMNQGLRHQRTRRVEDINPDLLLGQILKLKEYYVDDVGTVDILNRDFIRREGIHSYAGISLRVGLHPVGILFISYRKPYTFTEDDKHIFRIFANQAAITINNGRLMARQQDRFEYFKSLYEAGKVITNSIHKDEIINNLLAHARTITGISGGQALFSLFFQYDENTGKMSITHVHPPDIKSDMEEKIGTEFDVHSGIDGHIGVCGRAVLNRKALLVGDVSKNDDYLRYSEQTCSELAIPLMNRDKNQIVGVLNVEHSEVNGLDAYDKDALQMLVYQAEIAIQNAEQFEELRQVQQALTARTAVAFMGLASSTWRHEVNKFAGVIRDYNTLMQKSLLNGSMKYIPFVRKRIRKIQPYQETIEKMVRLIQKTPITAPLSSEEGVECIQANDLIRERIIRLLETREVLRDAADIQVDWQLQLPDDARVRVSRAWMRRAIDVLFYNACEAMEKSDIKKLTIKTYLDRQQAVMSIADTGSGIPPAIQRKLFQAKISKQEGERGAGMGLLLSQLIVQTYQGEIKLISTGESGTEMGIFLPLQ